MIRTSNFILSDKFFLPNCKIKLNVDESTYVNLHLDRPIVVVWDVGYARYGVLAEVYSFERGLDMRINLHLLSSNVVHVFKRSALEVDYLVASSIELSNSDLLNMAQEVISYLNKSLVTLHREFKNNVYGKANGLISTISDFLAKMTRYINSGEMFNLSCLIYELFTFMCHQGKLRFFFWQGNVNSKTALLKAVIAYQVQANVIQLKIKHRQEKKLEDFQKQAYINSQIQIFKEQLKSSDQAETDNLSSKWKKAPKTFQKAFKRELGKFNSMPSSSLPEYFCQKKLVEYLSKLPWVSSKEELNITEAAEKLDKSHYNLYEVKDQVIDFITLTQYSSKLKTLCLVGAPGIGKTSIAKMIAKVMNRDFVYLNLAGCWDSVMLKGCQKVFTNSHPGMIISEMAKLERNDPVILLDEIDKTKTDLRRGASSSLEQALIELLDKDNNFNFKDLFLEEGYDLSKVLFITTANDVRGIPEPLLNRLELITIESYDVEEKIDIAQGWLIPKLKSEFKVNIGLEVGREILLELINNYTLEGGVRSLELRLKTLMIKWLRNKDLQLNPDLLKLIFKNQYIKGDSHTFDGKFTVDYVGQSLGMYASSVQGGVNKIDVVGWPRLSDSERREQTMTGLLGDSLKESFKVALTGLFSHSVLWSLDKKMCDFMKASRLHFHMLPGGTSKDGPSAGLAIATALMSNLIGMKAPAIPMTGEIGMRGEVLAIGGVKQKISGAKRNNFLKVIVPEANRIDVENSKIQGMEVCFVKDLTDAFKVLWPDYFTQPNKKKALAT